MGSNKSRVFKGLTVGLVALTVAACGGGGSSAGGDSPDCGQTKIMPIGDSITQGNTSHQSYRRPLFFQLSERYNVDFVGSTRSNYGGSNPNSDFDLDHEGHWGWTTDQVLARINGWLQGRVPDIAIIHLGTNDLLKQGQSGSGIANELSQLIGILRNNNPNIGVVLSTVIPNARVSVADLNTNIRRLGNELNTGNSPVEVTEHSNVGVGDTYDGIHPNSTGENKMATNFTNSINNLSGKVTVCRK
ncbi:SGNH/GDSL hydrolase family protein [Gammaproteobacteria bacterium]|nr:SGNH/GDSL hydrolase family protein [Gammaproteobacteria bacterium]